MLAVALIPLAGFVLLVVADLGTVSRATLEETNRTLLDNIEREQQQELDNQATTVRAKLDGLATQFEIARQRVLAALQAAAAPGASGAAGAAAAGPLLPAGATGLLYRQDDGPQPGHSSLLVGPAGGAEAQQRDAVAAVTLPTVEQALVDVRAAQPAIRAAWLADPATGVVRATPQIGDLLSGVAQGRIDPANPANRGGGAAFSALARSVRDAASDPPPWDGDPGQVAPAGAAVPAYTTAYQTRTPDEAGVTVYQPLGGNVHLVLGVDVELHQLLGDTVAVAASERPHAYSVLLDSAGRLLGGGDGLAGDLHLGAHWVGMRPQLPAALEAGLGPVLQTGVRHTVSADLGGSPHDVFTAPLRQAHWVLVSAVPTKGFLPDQAALSRGIDSGVRHLLRDALPLLVFLLALALLLANLISRRVVGPVRALTVAAERLGAGHIEEPVPPQGADEVGLLAASLERMRREVTASRDAILGAARELEGRVAERTAELRERNEELLALNTLAASLTHSLEPALLLEGALDTLRAILPLEEGQGFVLEDGGLRGLATTSGKVPRHGEGLASVASAAAQARDLVVRAAAGGVLVGLPLATGDGLQGAIGLMARPGWRLQGRSRALLRGVGDQTGLALRTAALSAEGRELAVLEERTRLAREIHDTMAQQLTAIVLQLEAAEAFVARDAGRARAVVVEARELARQTLAEARRSVWNLRPAPLDATGLAGAVRVEAERLQQRSGIRARVRVHGLPRDLPLAPEVEVGLFRIVQEALANAARHSGARRIDVHLELRDPDLVVRVEDDGQGFEAGDDLPGRFGLVGMRERARLIGAELSIERREPTGTRVRVSVPLRSGERELASA